ncbi:hypothetical protein [Vreelandella sp. TE19]
MSDDVSMTICIGDQSECESDTDGTHTHPPDTTSEPPPSEALEGRARHAGNSRPDWRVAASFPDFCQVGNTVVGFDSTASLDSPTSYSPNVIMGGQRTYRVGDLSQGTQGNNGAGVVSGTSQGSGHVLFLTGQENVRANGQPVVIDGSEAMINCNAAGVGGAKGYVYTNTQAVDSQPETPDEPPTTAASLQQQAQANLERVGELRDALNENPNGKTAAETEALHAEVQQAIADTRVQQEALMEAMREGRLQGDDALATMMDVDEAARQAANMQPEAERQVTYSSEGGRKGREAAVFIAEVATPYGTWVDIKDTIQLWGEGRYLAATGMTALTAVSVIPGVGLIRKGDNAIDAVRTTDRTVDAAEDANRGRPSGSNDGTRVEQNSGRVERGAGNTVNVREISARNRYMGRTPDKYSRTGREVLERMRVEGLIQGEGPLLRGNPNNLHLINPDGSTARIGANIDMAHKVDAVTWWNDTGRFFGPKSPEVRQFMLNADNYELQLRSINRSDGARLGQTYQPPITPDFSTLKR